MNINAQHTLLPRDSWCWTKNVSPWMLVLAAKSLKTCSKPMIEKCSQKLLEILWVLVKVSVLCQFYFGKFSLFLYYYYIITLTTSISSKQLLYLRQYNSRIVLFQAPFLMRLQLKNDIKRIYHIFMGGTASIVVQAVFWCTNLQ